ncbi:hypothetical protein ACSAZK_03970 [Methanosarcina sp. Mfa9]|uniref:hypothetical protein n=1 Tax=Methanosarcina sp. Mfa9 TaxID=3439063 RepID=UPI003F838FDC
MSEKTKSQIYLEKMQSKFYEDEITGHLSWINNPEFLEEFKKIYPEVDFNEIENYMEKTDLPTIYENPDTYSILFDLFEQIEKSAKELLSRLPMRPLIGTLPSGKVNAMAIKVPDTDEFMVVFEDQLFTFANLIAKIIAQSIPFNPSLTVK